MHRQRLERAYKFLKEELPGILEARRATFNMGFWIRDDHGCQTAGCACGWMAHEGVFKDDPEFPKFINSETLNRRHGYTDMRPNAHLYPLLNGKDNYEAFAEFFGIDDLEAEKLFDPETYYDPDEEEYPYISPEDVAARIYELLHPQTKEDK